MSVVSIFEFPVDEHIADNDRQDALIENSFLYKLAESVVDFVLVAALVEPDPAAEIVVGADDVPPASLQYHGQHLVGK